MQYRIFNDAANLAQSQSRPKAGDREFLIHAHRHSFAGPSMPDKRKGALEAKAKVNGVDWIVLMGWSAVVVVPSTPLHLD